MTETSPASASAPVSGAASAAEAPSAPVSVRFFAAAAEAAGTEQLRLPVPAGGVAVVDLLAELPRLVRAQQPTADATEDSHDTTEDRHDDAGVMSASLEQVCARSSFLVNGVRAQPETARLHPGDQLDVLPPFAGG